MNNGASFTWWQRVLGLAGTALVFYLIIFVALARVDVSGWVPTSRITQHIIELWPHLPFFAVEREPVGNGKQEEVFYTVPTKQFTKAEMDRMPKGTNAVAEPGKLSEKGK